MWENSYSSGNLYPNSQLPIDYDFVFDKNPLANHLQRNAFNYANSVYQDGMTLWEREDSAYQRMVADMKKAGLNPWTGIASGGLSAGSINPSLDSLSSLIAVLGSVQAEMKTNNYAIKSQTSAAKDIFGALEKALGTVMTILG